MKMEPIVCSETSAIRTQTSGNYPKENILHVEHDESLKSKILLFYFDFDSTIILLDGDSHHVWKNCFVLFFANILYTP